MSRFCVHVKIQLFALRWLKPRQTLKTLFYSLTLIYFLGIGSPHPPEISRRKHVQSLVSDLLCVKSTGSRKPVDIQWDPWSCVYIYTCTPTHTPTHHDIYIYIYIYISDREKTVCLSTETVLETSTQLRAHINAILYIYIGYIGGMYGIHLGGQHLHQQKRKNGASAVAPLLVPRVCVFYHHSNLVWTNLVGHTT